MKVYNSRRVDKLTRRKACCLPGILWGVRFNRQGAKKAAVYRQYSYGILSVQLCWTFGFPMLDLWYQNALLFWYRFFFLFT